MTLLTIAIDTIKNLNRKEEHNTVPRFVFLGGIGLLFITFVLSHFLRSELLSDVMIGCILSLTNAFLGYMFIERAFLYQSNLFVIFSLGGLALRFFLMVVSVAIVLILLPSVNLAAFLVAFMTSYAILLFAEVFYVNSKVDQLKPRNA